MCLMTITNGHRILHIRDKFYVKLYIAAWKSIVLADSTKLKWLLHLTPLIQRNDILKHHICVDVNGVKLQPEQISKAQKYCKWAGSALNYDDVSEAISNLQKALKLLTTGVDSWGAAWHHPMNQTGPTGLLLQRCLVGLGCFIYLNISYLYYFTNNSYLFMLCIFCIIHCRIVLDLS